MENMDQEERISWRRMEGPFRPTGCFLNSCLGRAVGAILRSREGWGTVGNMVEYSQGNIGVRLSCNYSYGRGKAGVRSRNNGVRSRQH